VTAPFPLLRQYGGRAVAPLAGRVRVVEGRFADDSGLIGMYGISEFSAVHLVRRGDEGEIERRYDRAAAARRNVVRVFAMARNLFDLSPSQPGYWTAMDRAVTLGAQRGLRTEKCLFPDAQLVIPSMADRRALVRDFAAFCREHPTVIPSLSNEPGNNGFVSEVDPDLLELADIFAEAFGSRAFSIGDPGDVVTSEEGGEPLAGYFRTLAAHSDILLLHDSRDEDPGRFARWVDHLKGLDDFRSRVRPGVAFWHDEPMGMAGVRDVPLPNGRTYRRENRPEALVAAACVAAITQTGFTTHYISEQNDTIPGLEESAIAADIPQTPAWRFINAGIGGSPVTGFSGFEKVRPSTDGHQAWACAYGLQKGAITWAPGFRAERVFNGNNVEVWRATR
jgi:hypothetical protein